MDSPKSRRSAKVGATLQAVLGEAIRFDLKDPALTEAELISVTEVDVSADLGVATVYVTGTFESADAADAALQGLERAATRLRGLIAQRVRLKRIPALRFRMDEAISHGRRIERILDELKGDEPEPEPDRGSRTVDARLPPGEHEAPDHE
jgi:ribosome-binding factor A